MSLNSDTPIDHLMPAVYEELRRLASHYMLGEREDHTLQPTALVHEAYLRLLQQKSEGWLNREQFVAAAAQMMRRILINHANARNADKRSGYANRVVLDDALDALETASSADAISLDRVLTRLSSLDARQGQIVELRCFMGLSVEETSALLQISTATVKREWSTARLWLQKELRLAGKLEE